MKKTKLSELNIDELTPKQIEELILGSVSTSVEDLPKDKKYSAALLLGGLPSAIYRRTMRAIEMYNKGYVQKIVLSGGNGWRHNVTPEVIQQRLKLVRNYIPGTQEYTDEELGKMTEVEFMKMILDSKGVPDEDLVYEHFSTNTLENMQNASIIMEGKQRQRPLNFERIIIVTDDYHAKRSVLTAQATINVKGKQPEIIASSVDTRPSNKTLKDAAQRLPLYASRGNIYDATVKISKNGKIEVIDKSKENNPKGR